VKDISSNQDYMSRVLGLLKGKVKELDSDKVIKVAVCRCIGVLLAKYRLSASDLVFILDSLAHKLKIEVEKIYIVNTLTYFSKEQPLGKEVVAALENVVRQCAENLGSANFELNLKAI
jgi:hypothetical protein